MQLFKGKDALCKGFLTFMPVPPEVTTLKLEALRYLAFVKLNAPMGYPRFLDVLREYKEKRLDAGQTMDKGMQLFKGRDALYEGFLKFAPPGYQPSLATNPGSTTELDKTDERLQEAKENTKTYTDSEDGESGPEIETGSPIQTQLRSEMRRTMS
jgi:histone deacetylase complex regulatory component SIN3